MLICAYFGIRLCSFVPTFRFLGLELGCLFICAYFPFSRFGISCCLFICAYFPFSRFGISSFVPTLFSRFGITLCSFLPTFRFLGLELGCVHLCLFSVFSVWN